MLARGGVARAVLRVAAAVVAGALLALVLRALLFAGTAFAGRRLASECARVLPEVPWLDPVYTRAALWSLTQVRIDGIAIQGMPGALLHGLASSIFLEPSLANFGLLRVVLEPGSPLLGRLAAATVAHAGVLAVGMVLVQRGWTRQRMDLVVAGLTCQVTVAIGILSARPSVAELEATGLVFALNALLPGDALGSVAISDFVDTVNRPFASAVLVGLALLLAYAPTLLALAMRRRSTTSVAVALAVAVGSTAYAGAWPSAPQSARPIVAAPVTTLELRELHRLPPVVMTASSTMPMSVGDRWYLEPRVQASGPSKVEISGAPHEYTYIVNGRPEVIRGMGLNTRYASTMTPELRRVQLESDFSALARLGVNTVTGWDPLEFDSTLFGVANVHGIGVVPPFDLDPEADYSDPDVRSRLSSEVVAWVERYREQPALRMWGIGNEVLHKIVHPAWVGPQDPARERNARAFADWLVETADTIHALDPDHPVTYRSAEDAFVGWVVDALRRRGGGPRPWFVWGTNCYQDHLSHIADSWPDSGFEGALWVSEFAPGTLAIPDRPAGFASMWSVIRQHPGWVLGGAAYAWTRNGPEGIDRNFGLTDDGVVVDGRALEMLEELFRAQE